MKVERPLSPVIKLGIHNPRKKERQKSFCVSILFEMVCLIRRREIFLYSSVFPLFFEKRRIKENW